MHAVAFVEIPAAEYEANKDYSVEDFVVKQLEPFDYNNENYYHTEYEDCCDDPDCDECGGQGTRSNSYNENGFYDWFEIGGRWRGAFYNTPAGTRSVDIDIIKPRHIRRFTNRYGDLSQVEHLITVDGDNVVSPTKWLTDPENMDKYLVVIDYHY